MSHVAQDLRFALRQLRHRPSFVALVVSTLALGIGANAAIFSVVDGVLLSPLPYPEPERLVRVYSQFPSLGFDRFWISAPEYLELRRFNRSFEHLGAYVPTAVNVGGRERPVRARTAVATASLFAVLGVEADRGRTFTAEEDRPGADPVVVLSSELWHKAWGGDPALLGRTIEVDGERRTVVGILPPGFDVEERGFELWLPAALDEADPGGRGSHGWNLIGRLREGVSLARAEEELATLLTRWEEEVPGDQHRPNPDRHPLVYRPLHGELVGETRPALALLAGVVGFVLLIACANVANLLLARAEGRQREIAVRTALGAGQGQLMRQFLTESVLLAVLGGLLGLGLAALGLELLVLAEPEGVPRLREVGLDLRVLLFTLGVSVATGLLFGLAPAFHSLRGGLSSALKDGGRTSAGRGRGRVRRALVVGEVALAAVLVVGAGLLLKSFWTLLRVDPGLASEGVLTFQLALPSTTYPEPVQVVAFYERLIAELEGLPGVSGAAAVRGLPPKRSINANDTEFEGLPEEPGGPVHNVDYYQYVSPDYFQVMRIPVTGGPGFQQTDAADGAPVVVINQRLAEVFYPGENPVGRRLRRGWYDDEEPWFTIVGVAGDVKQGGLDQPAGTELYFLHRQLPATVPDDLHRTLYLVVRTTGDPWALAGVVRERVAALDPTLPVDRLAPLSQVMGESVARSRFLAVLVAVFGTLALVLAVVGTYGVLSYAVEQRRHEMGVRLALGARPGDVLRLVLAQGMGWVGAGVALGVTLALLLGQVVATVLFGVSPRDPLTLAGVVLLLSATGLAACGVPALKATRADPLDTLRAE